ncbi:MAG: hypothetical protein NTV51_03390 [Verrucomicrobia bacterium]|nr:hypothetical protein [Verrucomicrobiota bacterium]
MPALIGILLALAVAAFGRLAGFDRDRAFYPTVLIVVASYYDLFGVIGGSTHALLLESGVAAVFLVLAWLGHRHSTWIVVAGLFAHGVFDFFHGHVIANPGLPVWWPPFCLAYDVTAAGLLAWLTLRQRRTA